jgi:hypothetical protein
MKSSFSKWIVSSIDSPEFDPTPKIIWVILIIMFLVSVSMIMAQDVPKVGDTVPIASGTAADLEKAPATVPASSKSMVPGGVQVGVLDNTPVFIIDIADVNWSDPRIKAEPWYFKPAGVAKVIGSNTVANVEGNPKSWAAAGIVATLAATGQLEPIVENVEKLFGGGSDDKDKQGQQAAQPATKPVPAVDVQGQYNSVTVPATAIDGPIVVNGAYNNVTVTEPAFQTL